MAVMTYSGVRKSWRKILDKVHDDNEAAIIQENHGENTVMLAEEEYNNLMGTIFLARNSGSPRHSQASIQQPKEKQL